MQSDFEPTQPAPAGSDLSTQLTVTFVATFEASAGRRVTDLAALQAGVCAFVRAAKECGDPPQRVIVALKELTIERVRGGPRDHRSEQHRWLRESLIAWCLDEYYGPDSRTNVPAGGQRRVTAEGRPD